VNASAGSGGTINPSGAVAAACGSDPSFTITAGAGFEVEDVLVDDISVGAIMDYTFTDILENHTISASFVDVAGPVVSVLTPNGGEETIAFHVTTIRWTATDNVSVDSTQVDVSLDGPGGPWTNILLTNTTVDSVDWTPPNTCSNQALIRVITKDPSGNIGSDQSDAVFQVKCGVLDVPGEGRMALGLRVPNPVGVGPVKMRVALPAAGPASLEIIAVTGQRMWSERFMAAEGIHEWTWDGRDRAGQLVQAGVYFARLVTLAGDRRVRFVVLP
jgi:hypothetical protein